MAEPDLDIDKLDPKIQASLRDLVKDNMRQITETLGNGNDDATKALADGGMVLTQPSDADMATALATITPYWDEWAQSKGPKAVEALKKVRDALGR